MIFAALLGGIFNALRGAGHKALNIAAFAVFSGFIVTEWWQVPLCAAAMWAGQALSYGEIVGSEGILGGHWKAHGAALVRGGYWGGLIAIAMWSMYPLIAGACFGICYHTAYLFDKVRPEINAWRWGEVMFGAILWGSCVI